MSNFLRLSPDGQTMVLGYSLSDDVMMYPPKRSYMETISAFRVSTFVYVKKLFRWIPVGDFTIQGASAGCSECTMQFFFIEMASETLATLQIGLDLSLAPWQSEVQVWWLGDDWQPMGPPIRPVDENQTIVSIAIADEANFLEERMMVVALGISDGMVQLWTTEASDHGDYPSLTWGTLGNPIQGNNFLFGQQVKLSRDGSILAVLGREAIPPDDDDSMSPSCLIRMFHYSESEEDWVQLGQDITRENDGDELDCVNVNLSGDGQTVVSGYRSYEKDCPEFNEPRGHLRVWSWDDSSHKWNRKGADLDTLFPDTKLDHDFSFGLEREHHVSDDGNRVTVSAMEVVPLSRVDDEKFVYYIATFEWDGTKWSQMPGTMETPAYPYWDMDSEGNNLAVGSLLKENSPSGLVQTYEARARKDNADAAVSVQ